MRNPPKSATRSAMATKARVAISAAWMQVFTTLPNAVERSGSEVSGVVCDRPLVRVIGAAPVHYNKHTPTRGAREKFYTSHKGMLRVLPQFRYTSPPF